MSSKTGALNENHRLKKNRLKQKAPPKIVDNDQTGFFPGRFLGRTLD